MEKYFPGQKATDLTLMVQITVAVLFKIVFGNRIQPVRLFLVMTISLKLGKFLVGMSG
jgi:hypothetical protein